MIKVHRKSGRMLTLVAVLSSTSAAADWRDKVDPWLLNELAPGAGGSGSAAEFLIILAEQADVAGAARFSAKPERGRFVFERLAETAERSQADLQDELNRAGIPFRPFWIVNMIQATGDLGLVASLASRIDVAAIAANARAPHDRTVLDPEARRAPESPEAVEWNIQKTNAPQVWAMKYTGQGAVIGGQDTGYDWDHPALQAKYRGWNGAVADHNHNWHDSVHSDIDGNGTNAACGFNSLQPCDDNNHGTHTMGTMVGDDGAGNQIGMAPGAKWVSCRNMEEGWGTVATYSECYQWFVAPTDLGGANPDPALAPDVINNSWGCPFSGAPGGAECVGQSANVMRAVVENLRAAGIFTAHSAGNAGPTCSSVNTPAGIYDASFTVGSTNSADGLSGFSSRGPVTVDASGRRKPDIAAPGDGIRSSVPGGSYQSGWSGTSMAAPHVAGLVALLISADNALAGNVDALEELIREGAFTGVTTSGTCGGMTSAVIPNNHFGFGRIDAYATVQLRLSGFLFRDGFETGLTDDWSSTGP
jgi:subtilisin family serine protease